MTMTGGTPLTDLDCGVQAPQNTLTHGDWVLIGVALAIARDRAVNIAYSPDHELLGPITDHFHARAKDYGSLLNRLIDLQLVPDK